MTTIIIILLLLAAVYSGGMWLFTFFRMWQGDPAQLTQDEQFAIELFTFHLGLCFILALGFAGVLHQLGG